MRSPKTKAPPTIPSPEISSSLPSPSAGSRGRAAAETRAGPPDQQIAALREALATLPERERLALHAFYLQEMNVEQARTVLGLSRSGLYRVLSCARRRLARLLRQRETEPWPVPTRTNGRC